MCSSEFLQGLVRGEVPIEPRDGEILRATYRAGVRYLDEALGELFNALRTSGVWDQMLVVVTSDHGFVELDPKASIVYCTADETVREAVGRLGIHRFKRKPVSNARLIANVTQGSARWPSISCPTCLSIARYRQNFTPSTLRQLPQSRFKMTIILVDASDPFCQPVLLAVSRRITAEWSPGRRRHNSHPWSYPYGRSSN